MKIDKRCLVLLTDMTLGGVTTSAVNFCNGLVERGARVDILLMDVDSDTANRGYSAASRIGQSLELEFEAYSRDKESVQKAGAVGAGPCEKDRE